MTTGLCAAAVTLTHEEVQRLDNLPGAMNEVSEADGCVYLAGHPGPHAYEAQAQEADDGETAWWVVWEGPEQPDSKPYKIMPIPSCSAKRDDDALLVDYCPYPEGHEAPHRWK